MINIILITAENDALSDFESGLRQDKEIKIIQVNSCQKAFDLISEKVFDLAVADENIAGTPGLKFIEKLVSVNPLLNCALISSLGAKDFHEASEGLGVLMQLPLRPDQKHAEILLQKLKAVLNLMM